MSGEGPFSGLYLLTVSSRGREDKSTLCGLFHKALIPLTRSLPLRPNYLPLATPARFQRMNLVGGGRSTNLQTVAIYKVTGIDCWEKQKSPRRCMEWRTQEKLRQVSCLISTGILRLLGCKAASVPTVWKQVVSGGTRSPCQQVAWKGKGVAKS